VSRIVVGVDGSDEGAAALAFAIEEAELRTLPLRVVCAWSIPAIEYPGGAVVPTPDLVENAEEHANTVLREAAAAVGRRVAVEAVAVPGAASEVLVEQAQGATLLVVGSRGHGAVASLLLGSVSTALAHHAPCPLTIVRPHPTSH
jgi:nucleotide-binding universal stress UspA family protein